MDRVASTLLLTAFLMLFSGMGKKPSTPPHPFEVNPKAKEQVQKLWPSDPASQMDGLQVMEIMEVKRQRVRAQWLQFAKRSPQNLFIPYEMLGKDRPQQQQMHSAINPDLESRYSQVELIEFLLSETELDPILVDRAEDRLRVLNAEITELQSHQ